MIRSLIINHVPLIWGQGLEIEKLITVRAQHKANMIDHPFIDLHICLGDLNKAWNECGPIIQSSGHKVKFNKIHMSLMELSDAGI